MSSPAVDNDTFLEPTRLTDIILKVQGKELHTSRAILAMVSPVFRAMFECDFKEKHEKQVELPEKTFEEVLLLLRVLCHKVELEDLEATEMVSLIHLADEYQMTILIKDCGKHLLDLTQHGHIPEIDLFFKMLDLAIRYSLDGLRDNCVSYLTRNIRGRIEDTAMYKTLSPEGKILLLESTVQQIRCQRESMKQIVHEHDNHCDCKTNNCNHYSYFTCIPLSNLPHTSKVSQKYCSRCLENIGHNVTEELLK